MKTDNVWIVTAFGVSVTGIIIILISAYIGFTSSENLSEKRRILGCKDCICAKKLAILDFNKGKGKIFVNDFSDDNNEFPNNWYRILESKFKIKVINVGDVYFTETHCYNNTIDSLLILKYGIENLELSFNNAKKLKVKKQN